MKDDVIEALASKVARFVAFDQGRIVGLFVGVPNLFYLIRNAYVQNAGDAPGVHDGAPDRFIRALVHIYRDLADRQEKITMLSTQ